MKQLSTAKPIAGKAYGSIPHLGGSRKNDGKDRDLTPGQTKQLLESPPANHYVYVAEKLDGSCVAVAKLYNGLIVPLTRSGYRASSSPYAQHRVFHQWVMDNLQMFDTMLNLGERIVGEWLLQAHGLLYKLDAPPFVPFDIFLQNKGRAKYLYTYSKAQEAGLKYPAILSYGKPLTIEQAMDMLDSNYASFTTFPVVEGRREGAVWRLESAHLDKAGNSCKFLAKYVRPDFEPGKYLPNLSGKDAVYNEGYQDWLSPTALSMMESI